MYKALKIEQPQKDNSLIWKPIALNDEKFASEYRNKKSESINCVK